MKIGSFFFFREKYRLTVHPFDGNPFFPIGVSEDPRGKNSSHRKVKFTHRWNLINSLIEADSSTPIQPLDYNVYDFARNNNDFFRYFTFCPF